MSIYVRINKINTTPEQVFKDEQFCDAVFSPPIPKHIRIVMDMLASLLTGVLIVNVLQGTISTFGRVIFFIAAAYFAYSFILSFLYSFIKHRIHKRKMVQHLLQMPLDRLRSERAKFLYFLEIQDEPLRVRNYFEQVFNEAEDIAVSRETVKT